MIAKTEDDIAGLRNAGRKLARALEAVKRLVVPGVSTLALEKEARRVIAEEGGRPSFLGYKEYPAALCVSVNDEIVHGIPSASKKIESGDIVGLDVGLEWCGYFVDMAITVAVGNVPKNIKDFLVIPRIALDHAVKIVRPGMTTGDLGLEIQTMVEKLGGTVIRDLVGHGVGRAIHEDPPIPNFGTKGNGPALREGEIIAIEPMVSLGSAHTKTDADGWTVRTDDGSLAAHFEHTVLLGNNGATVLTKL